MGQLTPRAGLYLPGGGATGTNVPDETADIDKLNDNFRKVDQLLGVRNVPSASSYVGNFDGDLIYPADDELLRIYSSDTGKLEYPRVRGSNLYTGSDAEREAYTSDARYMDAWRSTDDMREYIKGQTAWVHRPDFGYGTYLWLLSRTIQAGWTVLSTPANWQLFEGMYGSAVTDNFSTGIKVPFNGIYQITFTIQIAIPTTGLICVKRNSTTSSTEGIVTGTTYNSSTGTQTGQTCTAFRRLFKDDILTPAIWAAIVPSSGGPWGLTASATQFSVKLLKQEGLPD